MESSSHDNVLSNTLASEPHLGRESGGHPMLLGVEGPLKNQRFTLNKKIITIGRDMSADILLKDSQASRRHAHVINTNIGKRDEPQEYMLYDAGLTAGTFVNGERIGEKGVLLREQDRIQMGRSIFCFLFHDESEMTVDRKIEKIATRDTLTGLLKPLSFKQSLEQEVARAKRYKRPLSLVMLSISCLEEIIEKYGPTARQTVLKELAGFVTDYCRTNDVASRLDEDEIAVTMPETDGESALGVATRMIQAISELNILHGNTPLKIEINAGLAQWDWQVGSVESFLSRTEQALQEAQQEGKTGAALFEPKDTTPAPEE